MRHSFIKHSKHSFTCFIASGTMPFRPDVAIGIALLFCGPLPAALSYFIFWVFMFLALQEFIGIVRIIRERFSNDAAVPDAEAE